MYSATHNGTVFFNTDFESDLYALESASLSLEAGKAGDFTFNIPITNIAYNSLEKLASYIDVFRDGELIFSGRVYSIEETFDTMRLVSCEGLFAVLNDSIIRPLTINAQLSELITEFLTQHNAQVGTDKQVQLGNITVSDDYVYRAFEAYETTMSRLQDLVDSYGGYMRIRKEEEGLFLDWYETFTEEATQSINLGENLLDVTQESDSSDIITVLIPLGAEVENADGTKSKLTIAGIQEQQGRDYIENAEGIAAYGRIVGTQEWSDVTVDTNLLQKATAYLNEHSKSRVQISINAVDLAGLNASIDAFKIGTVIHVESAVNGISDDFVCLTQNFDLMDPAQDVLTLSTTRLGFLGGQSAVLNRITNIQNTIVSNYATNTDVTSLTEQVQSNTTAIEQNSEAIGLKAETSSVNDLASRVASLELTSENLNLYFGENGYLTTWFNFSEDGLKIGKADSEYHTEQDNESYSIVNSAGDVLFTVTPDGTRQETAEVEAQVKFSYGGAGQWAIREASYVSGVGVNLDDVWIGG